MWVRELSPPRPSPHRTTLPATGPTKNNWRFRHASHIPPSTPHAISGLRRVGADGDPAGPSLPRLRSREQRRQHSATFHHWRHDHKRIVARLQPSKCEHRQPHFWLRDAEGDGFSYRLREEGSNNYFQIDTSGQLTTTDQALPDPGLNRPEQRRILSGRKRLRSWHHQLPPSPLRLHQGYHQRHKGQGGYRIAGDRRA